MLFRIFGSHTRLVETFRSRPFRAPIFRSAYGDLKIPARGRCDLKIARSELILFYFTSKFSEFSTTWVDGVSTISLSSAVMKKQIGL